MPCIYKITNSINNKIYIGKTKKTAEERFKDHLCTARVYKNGNCKKYAKSRLYPAMNKYGYDNFKVEVVENCLEEELNTLEKNYIQKFNSTNPNVGYNISKGGDGGDLFKGHKHSKETRKILSEKNYWKSHKQTEEMNKKRSEALKKYNNKKIQCLDSGEIFNSQSEAKEKYGVSLYHALKTGGRCDGKFYIILPVDKPYGYEKDEREKIIQERTEKELRKKQESLEKGKKTVASRSKEEKDKIKEKQRLAIKNRTKEQAETIHNNKSIAEKKKWQMFSEEDKKLRAQLSRDIMLNVHKNRTKEQEEEISKKNSEAQKGKKLLKNIQTQEMKTLMKKDIGDYDPSIWKRCHINGELWQEE